jgi:transposase InsO family protein
VLGVTKKVITMEAKLLAVFTSGLKLNVQALCAELGISRQSLYKYRHRWEAEGPPGLVERSRRPRSSPGQTPVEVEDAIVRLRKELVVDNGAQAIAWHLARGGVTVSASTVHRVLVRRGMVTPQPHKRPKSAWRRFEWPRPNDAWQIDATCWALADNREIWIMDILDDHSRVLIAARVCEGPTAAAAWDALCHGIAEWGVPAHMMSDNGVCFTSRFSFNGGENDFERSLRALGVRHIPSSPGHPQTCGKLERSHQTTKRWLQALGPASTPTHLQAQLDHWRVHYNHHRPHKAANGRTPLDRWHATPPATPHDPLPAPPATGVRRVSSNGIIAWDGHTIGIDSRRAGQHVLVVARDLELTIHGQGGLIRQLTINPTRRHQPNGHPSGRRTDPLLSAMSQ